MTMSSSSARVVSSGSTLRSRLLRGAGWLTIGQAATLLLSFGRNALLARMIVPHDFGIALTFVITTMAIDAITDLGLDKALVQSPHGNNPEFLATVHSLTLTRSALIALCLFAASWWLADWYRAPEALLFYQILALAPLIRGASHLGVRQMHREMKYGPSVATDFAADLAAFVATVVAVAVHRHYSAALVGILTHSIVTVAASHWLAGSRYQLSWRSEFRESLTSFSWPILMNGFLLFISVNGDRLAVGRLTSMEELAKYGAAYTLAAVPFAALMRVQLALNLSTLSALQDDPEALGSRFRKLVLTAVAPALASVILSAVCGSFLLYVAFGEPYSAAGATFMWLTAMQAARMLRSCVGGLALAIGYTTSILASNVIRVAWFPLTIWLATHGGSIEMIAASLLVAETSANFAMLIAIRLRHVQGFRACVVPVCLTMAAIWGIVLQTSVLR
jgi:O-antigen/teichoic acid export membrane protein